MLKYNFHFLVATPTLSITSAVTSYIIDGDAVTFTCTSTSESNGAGTYAWKKDSAIL